MNIPIPPIGLLLASGAPKISDLACIFNWRKYLSVPMLHMIKVG